MAWAAVATSLQLTLTSSWQTIQATGPVDMVTTLNPRELAQVMIEADFQATPTDDAEFQILSSPDGGTTWDTSPIIPGSISNGTDPARVTVMIVGLERFKVQMKQTGSTDTINKGKIFVRQDGVSAT